MRLEEMKQPRVERLGYHVHVVPGVEFDSPQSLEYETPEFYWKLSGDTLSLLPKVRFTTERDARAVVEPLLKAWEIQAGLDAGGPVFSFEFRTMRFIDEASNSASGYGLHQLTASIEIARHYSEYPSPPSAVTITPDIETLWLRYSIYKQGREPLQTMAYFCYTVLTFAASPFKHKRDLEEAADHFNIDKTVLKKLTGLSTNKGDALTARKKTQDFRPLKPAEKAWLEAVIPAIIRTMMTAAATGSAPRLDMSQLPPL